MSRLGVRLLAFGLLLAVALTWLAGGPQEAGALAGLRGAGPGVAAGFLWIALAPAASVLVPPLLITAAGEALHAIWAKRRAKAVSPGLGSRSAPSDT